MKSTFSTLLSILLAGSAIAQEYTISQPTAPTTFSFGGLCRGQTFTPSIGVIPNPGSVTSLPLVEFTLYSGFLSSTSPSAATYLNIYDGDPNGSGNFIGSSTNTVDTTTTAGNTPYVWTFDQLPLVFGTKHWAIMSTTDTTGAIDVSASMRNDGATNAYAGGAGAGIVNALIIEQPAGNDTQFDAKFFIGIYGTFTISGTGCPSSAGLATLSNATRPAIGQTLQIDISNLAAVSVPLMVIGFASIPGGTPLAGILPAGPTCNLLITPDAVSSLPIGGSSASSMLAIPNNPSLLSSEIFFQGAQLDLVDFSVTARGRVFIGQ